MAASSTTDEAMASVDPPRKSLADVLALLPRELPPPVDANSHLYQFWLFIAQALLGGQADDEICRTFRLGGSIDDLTDVMYVRDHITRPFMEKDDVKSVIWHQLLVCWFGAGGPKQESYKWLLREGLAKTYAQTDSVLVTEIYKSVQERVAKLGIAAAFDGDSRAVKCRLCKQQGERVLQEWFGAVPSIAEALATGIAPDKLEKKLRSIFQIGELTAKEIFVHLSYVNPSVADTIRHIVVGPGARDGALLVLDGDVPGSTWPATRKDWFTGSAATLGGTGPEGLEAMRRIEKLQAWALKNVPRLDEACRAYRSHASHRLDPLLNFKLTREYLFDLADVEVMCCFYKNFVKMRQRAHLGANGPRGWERRGPQEPSVGPRPEWRGKPALGLDGQRLDPNHGRAEMRAAARRIRQEPENLRSTASLSLVAALPALKVTLGLNSELGDGGSRLDLSGLKRPRKQDPSHILVIGEVPYLAAAALLDNESLCHLDATNRTLNAMNRSHVGAWRSIGGRSFQGVELEVHGTFEQPALGSKKDRSKTVRIDWKARFGFFRKEVPLFSVPCEGAEITRAARPDEVAYLQCRLRTDMLENPDVLFNGAAGSACGSLGVSASDVAETGEIPADIVSHPMFRSDDRAGAGGNRPFAEDLADACELREVHALRRSLAEAYAAQDLAKTSQKPVPRCKMCSDQVSKKRLWEEARDS